MTSIRAVFALAIAATSAVLASCAAVPALVIGGVGTGIYIAKDRRTNDAMLADQRIEKSVAARIQNELKSDIVLDLSSYNRQLLLIGRARTEDAKRRAGEIARTVEGVRTVVNEIDLVSNRMPSSSTRDSGITTQVKARMVSAGGFDPQIVSVTTDGGVVYLQGLVTRAEGDQAAKVAATTAGVTRVVTLFEYIERAPNAGAPATTTAK